LQLFHHQSVLKPHLHISQVSSVSVFICVGSVGKHFGPFGPSVSLMINHGQQRVKIIQYKNCLQPRSSTDNEFIRVEGKNLIFSGKHLWEIDIPFNLWLSNICVMQLEIWHMPFMLQAISP